MQCILCLNLTMYNPPVGKGTCRKLKKDVDVLKEHDCKEWKIAPMSMARARMTFYKDGKVILK